MLGRSLEFPLLLLIESLDLRVLETAIGEDTDVDRGASRSSFRAQDIMEIAAKFSRVTGMVGVCPLATLFFCLLEAAIDCNDDGDDNDEGDGMEDDEIDEDEHDRADETRDDVGGDR